ncbi:MAG: hypothetical protein E3K32_11790 [wastewater metagenome]|nr:hypothetical protein [Candidatus Loosdrechtia aerotolerans]
MSFKSCTEFFHKNLFYFIIAASLAIHALVIFLSPQANRILNLSSFRERFVRMPDEYVVTLEIENTDTRKEQASDTKQKEIEKAQEKELEKKKYKTFTDTSDNKEDEETEVDTDKIGEKGSVAKDNFPDDKQPVNKEPHAEGHTKAPLLGKGNPADIQQPREQEATPQVLVTEEGTRDNNTPPRYADLPKGLEKQPLRYSQTPPVEESFQPQEIKKNMVKEETVISGETIQKERSLQTPKMEKLTLGRSIEQETESIPLQEGIVFTDKQDEINRGSETRDESLPLFQEEKLTENEANRTTEKLIEQSIERKEAKDPDILKPETPVPFMEKQDIESQREFERGLDEQENPYASEKPRVTFGVKAKPEESNREPVLFEETISNAAVPGAPSFNVKKHEYADYFKHIRDRISLYWFLGYGTRAEIKLETKNNKPIVIEFKVLPDGSIDEITILDDAGNFPLASRLISSVKNAAPLNPFPTKIKEPSIDVRFNFYFF